MASGADRLAEVLQVSRLRRRLPPPTARRALRERAGLTQTALAIALGVDPATVCRWERGDREPRRAQLASYVEALDQLAREVL